MKLTFGGHDLLLHHSGVLAWPAQELLIVSDLHLEKGSHYARRGFFLPPYDSADTLQRLLAVCAVLAPRRVLLLGDSFHDEQGYARLTGEAVSLFGELGRFAPIWVLGNHDKGFVPEGFEACVQYDLDGVMFRHEAEAGYQGYEISGHYHPKANLVHKGGRVAARCFMEDGTRLIMPSFGAYTGGLATTHPSLQGLFPKGHRMHVLSNTRVIQVKGKNDDA